MPLMNIDGVKIYYENSGESLDETIVFSHGLLFDHTMWDRQVDHFRERYRLIRYDHPGQGSSSMGSGVPVDIDSLAAHAVALIERLGVAPVHFVGLSTGGFVGMRIAARRPDLIRSLALLDTSAEVEANARDYRRLVWAVRLLGVKPVVPRVMPILFSESFLSDPERAEPRERERRRLGALRKETWRAARGVIERKPVVDELGTIDVPTLVVTGEDDVATTPDKSERIHAEIAGSELVRLPGVGHMSNIEAPEEINRLLDGFLAKVGGPG